VVDALACGERVGEERGSKWRKSFGWKWYLNGIN